MHHILMTDDIPGAPKDGVKNSDILFAELLHGNVLHAPPNRDGIERVVHQTSDDSVIFVAAPQRTPEDVDFGQRSIDLLIDMSCQARSRIAAWVDRANRVILPSHRYHAHLKTAPDELGAALRRRLDSTFILPFAISSAWFRKNGQPVKPRLSELLRLRGDGPIMTCAAISRPFKGIDKLTSAISTVLSRTKEVHFVINIVMSSNEKIPEELERIGREPQVTLFTDPCNACPVGLFDLFDGSDFFLHSSDVREAFNLTVVQSAAQRCGIVGFDSGIVGEFPASSAEGLVFKSPEDPTQAADALAQSIEKAIELFHRRQAYNWFVRLCRQWASRFVLSSVKSQWQLALDLN